MKNLPYLTLLQAPAWLLKHHDLTISRQALHKAAGAGRLVAMTTAGRPMTPRGTLFVSPAELARFARKSLKRRAKKKV